MKNNSGNRVANNFPAGAGQIARSNLFLLGHIPFLAGQTSIIVILNLWIFQTWNYKFFPYQRKRTDKLSGHLRIWLDKTYFWPDIVLWLAVICSPGQSVAGAVWLFCLSILCKLHNEKVKLIYPDTIIGDWYNSEINIPMSYSFKGRGKCSRGNVNHLNYVMQIQRDLQFLQVKFQAGKEGMKPLRVINKFMEEHQIM